MCPDTYSDCRGTTSAVWTASSRTGYNTDLNRNHLESLSNNNYNQSVLSHTIYSQCEPASPKKSTISSSRLNFPISQSTSSPIISNSSKNHKLTALSPSALSSNFEINNNLVSYVFQILKYKFYNLGKKCRDSLPQRLLF